MGNDGLANLITPQGTPLKPGVAVLKHPRNAPPIHPRVVQQISSLLKSHLIVLPMEYELMMDEMAEKEITAIHEAIHAILDMKKEAL
jgi:hypothetical protein